MLLVFVYLVRHVKVQFTPAKLLPPALGKLPGSPSGWRNR